MANTPNYNIEKPNVGGSVNVWGNILNAALDAFDAIVKTVSDDIVSAVSDAAQALSTANTAQQVADDAQQTADDALALAGTNQTYPDKFTRFNVSNTGIVLTLAHQGLVTATGTANDFALPTVSVPDGTTYKFYAETNSFNVISTLILTAVQPYTRVTFIANAAAPDKWDRIFEKGGAPHNSNLEYGLGDMVTQSGVTYICIGTPNLAFNPATSTTKWKPLFFTSTKQIANHVATFNGTGAGPNLAPTNEYGLSVAANRVQKLGTGQYQITFANTVPAGATILVTVSTAAASMRYFFNFTGGTTLTVNTQNNAGAATDAAHVSVLVMY
jgi:hypothetical protein